MNKPEPPPKPNGNPAIWDLVIADMRERDNEGRRKYGVPLQAGNGRDALVDAYQESLDRIAYQRQAIEEWSMMRREIEELRSLNKKLAAQLATVLVDTKMGLAMKARQR